MFPAFGHGTSKSLGPLNLIGVRSEPGHRLGEPALFERRQVFGRGLRGPLQARPLTPHGLEHGLGGLVPEPDDELVRVDGLDVELFEDRRREVVQVERDDVPRPAVNRRRQHVAVVGVGEGQRRDEGLVPGRRGSRGRARP